MRDAIVKAGEEFGLRLVGGRAYSANTLESGWIPSPLPAVYSGEKMKPYRQWLSADSYEAKASIGGSFVSKKIEDYYLTPWDMGYGSFIDFEHEFIGREALQKMANGPHRKKVTLALENDDVLKVIASQLQKTGRGKFWEFPSAVYSMHPYDKVAAGGKTVGISTWVGYSANEGRMLTIAILDAEHAEPGTEVTFVWGEENGGTRSRRSSGTSRWRSAPSSARCPTPRPRARSTPTAAGASRASVAKGPFRADHVGSLLRPRELHELREQVRHGRGSAADLPSRRWRHPRRGQAAGGPRPAGHHRRRVPPRLVAHRLPRRLRRRHAEIRGGRPLSRAQFKAVERSRR